ncbi:MAG: hypothetical protein KGM43_06370 [Planctomycetota bacterium]|nr:hypothetical protein [Planctomycetota bacterium]
MATQSLYPSTIGYEPTSPTQGVTLLTLTSTTNQAAFGFMSDGLPLTSVSFYMTVLSATATVAIYAQSSAAPYGPTGTALATTSSVTGTAPGFVTFTLSSWTPTAGVQYFAVISDSAASAGSTVQYVMAGLPLASAGSDRYGGRCLFTSANYGGSWTAQGQGPAGWYYTNASGTVGAPITSSPAYNVVQVAGTTEYGTMVTLPPGPALRVAGLMMAPIPHLTSALSAKYNLRIGTTAVTHLFPANPIQTGPIGAAQVVYSGSAQYMPAYFTTPVLVPGGSVITVTLSDPGDTTFWYASQLIHAFGGAGAGPSTMWPFAFGGVAPSFSTVTVTSGGTGTLAAQVSNQILPFSLILDTITGPYVPSAGISASRILGGI